MAVWFGPRWTARLVLPRDGRVDVAFRLSTEGARLQVGEIRYVSDVTQPIRLAASGCDVGISQDRLTLCTSLVSRTDCTDGFPSIPVVTCEDRDLVLGYGPLSAVLGRSFHDAAL